MTSLTFGEPAYDGICICPGCQRRAIKVIGVNDRGKPALVQGRRCAEHLGKCNQCWTLKAIDSYGRCEACRKGKTINELV